MQSKKWKERELFLLVKHFFLLLYFFGISISQNNCPCDSSIVISTSERKAEPRGSQTSNMKSFVTLVSGF